MLKSVTKYVFIDTNIALHFKRPDQVDWLKLTGADKVVLVAAPIILRELEKQKVSHKSQKLRERADNFIKWLDKFMEEPETEVRSNVTWLFLPYEPQIDFRNENLSKTVADDHLIASVLDFSRQSELIPIVAVADIGLKNKLRYRQIDVLVLTDDLRIPVEPGLLERENEELRKKLARIESRTPKLSIAFEGGAQHQVLDARDPKSYKVKSLEEIKEEHSYMTLATEAELSSSVGVWHGSEQKLRNDHRAKYNEQLDKFFRDYQIFLDSHAAWLETLCMHHLIELVIANDGTAPASNIDAELYFPEGVIPVDKDDIPDRPKPPVVPEKNQGILTSHFTDIRHLNFQDIAKKQQKWLTAHLSGTTNIELNENSVCISYPKLKHGFCEISDPLIFRFVSRDAVRSFNIDYQLSANEMPDAVEGKLHIRIDDIQQ